MSCQPNLRLRNTCCLIFSDGKAGANPRSLPSLALAIGRGEKSAQIGLELAATLTMVHRFLRRRASAMPTGKFPRSSR